jgi:hypothetical protein
VEDVSARHIKNAKLFWAISSPSTSVKMLNTVRSRRSALDWVRTRLRRLIRNRVVVWFACIVFAVLLIIMIMILLLNTDVSGVDDLLADIPLDVTGVRDILRWFWISLLIVTDRNHRAHLQPRSQYPWDLGQLDIGRMWRFQVTLVPWTFWPFRYYLLSGGPPGGCILRQVVESGYKHG